MSSQVPPSPSPRPIHRLLIANRGEVAVRIARSAADLDIETVAVFSEDDASCGHLRHANISHPLSGTGAAAYLDIQALISAAKHHQCDAVHPGYGLLSENPAFAEACCQAGLIFVGPDATTLTQLGDKSRARQLAQQSGLATSSGTHGATSLEEALAFFNALPTGAALMIKALAGGGGKGMRVVRKTDELSTAYQRCQSEAQRAFGSAEVYVERYIANARHIEVQIAGDGDQVVHLGERECSLQRQHQKLMEIAPSPSLDKQTRQAILDAALRIAQACHYRGLATVEFLLDQDSGEFVFLEVNPRLQVEHTVTEEVYGLDLVALQLQLAAGRSLADLNLLGSVSSPSHSPRGYAIQLRINAEQLSPEGTALPASGTLTEFRPPGGPGIRLDTHAYAGYTPNGAFDSLLAKLVVSSPTADFAAVIRKARRAVEEFCISGIDTNLSFFSKLLAREDVTRNTVNTRYVELHAAELCDTGSGNSGPDSGEICAPLNGIVNSVTISDGERVAQGQELATIEAMKLEHAITAPSHGVITSVYGRAGEPVTQGQVLFTFETGEADTTQAATESQQDLDAVRPDLALLQARLAETEDSARPRAVEKRRSRGQRTARENIADLCDPGSFTEYGQLTVAYLHARHSDETLRETTPADGFVMGMATINASLVGESAAQVVVGSYDATVMAGTQGHKNHQKTDRLFDLAREHRLPLVLFAEGGGGRPREDPVTIAALQNESFRKLAELSGHVPVVGIVSGRCFAGNAALLGMADVIIATDNSNIGMAGPALIEAGGLGQFAPEDIGPIGTQRRNGVVDISVKDEAEAVAVGKAYLSYFQGPVQHWQADDPRRLRHVIPESRLRAYDVRRVIHTLADSDSVLELRRDFGQAYVTALIRIEGRPMGVMANNPLHNAGAIDADSADKASRFMRLCDAHRLPILSLIDTPGIMVGPEAEESALVRHAARLFVTAASITVPIFAIVLRKAYGLGAMAAAGGDFHTPFFTIAWPTGELGGMGLEGGVRLAYKKELEAIDDPEERQRFFEERVASRYRKGQATYIASYFELDAVIDPADSRQWIRRGLDATANSLATSSKGRFIDTW